MKLITAILLVTLSTAGTAWAQSPSILQIVRDKISGVQQQKTAASNQALSGTQPKTPAAKPAAGSVSAPATASAKAAAPAKATASAAVKPSSAAAAKAAASPTPAKTAPAPASLAKTAPAKTAPAKTAPAVVAAKTPVKATATAPAKAPAKAVVATAPAKKDTPAKKDVPAVAVAKAAPKANSASETKPAADSSTDASDKKEGGYATAGNRRDPFVSPVVQHMASAGCSTGKRCLAIDQIALRGVVKSDAGMIAVVVNSLDKAYFLRENDPVFNGYVVKISGDSIVFKETVQDKLGHLSTREVVKKITTPAV